MARITVEDCIVKIPNRFELVLAAAQRARDVSAGAPLTVDRDNDKNPVVALREIAEETVDNETLHEALIQGLQRHREQDEPEDEDPDLMSLGEGLGLATAEEALSQDRSLVDEEIADEVRTLGEEAVEAGAEIADSADAIGPEEEHKGEDSAGEADEEDS